MEETAFAQPPATTIPKGNATAGYLTRGEFLELSGLSESQLRTMIARGRLRSSSHTRGRWALYTLADVERAKALKLGIEQDRRRTRQEQLGFTQNEALEVFRLIDQRVSLKDIFYKMNELPLPALQEIVKQYQALTNSLFLSPKELQEIADLGVEGDYPFRSGSQVVDVFRTAIKSQRCTSCRKRNRTVCDACASSKAKGIEPTR